MPENTPAEPPLAFTRYPRPVTSVHQIEITTHCNLRCKYCPSPKLHQPQFRGVPATYMTLEIFAAALKLAAHYEARGTQGELSITGIGETLLHPQWRDMIAMAREALPTNFISFSTNGLLVDDDVCEHLLKCKVPISISLHRPEKAQWAIATAVKWGVLCAISDGASVSTFDWAGQVSAPILSPSFPCGWLRQGWSAVLVDGRITTCCFDAPAKGVIGTVHDDPATLQVKPYSLCDSCHLTVPEPTPAREVELA